MAVHKINTVSEQYSYYNQTNGKLRQQNMTTNPVYDERKKAHSDKINNMKSLIRGANKDNQNKPKSVVESTLDYGKSIRESRTNTKSTVNELKQLKYNSKCISSQIRQAKKSTNAKQVASKARREVIQLKLKMSSGKYDKEELQAAIEHAKAMERAANKKARHLKEEELIKITDKPAGAGLTAAELEEKLENETEDAINKYEDEMAEKEEELEQLSEEEIAKIEEAMEASIEDMPEDIYDLLSEAMEDMMENTLENLMDGVMTVTDYEMTEDEFKVFKTKHRSSEDKSMIEADAKYLKAMFDIYDKRMNGGSGPITDGQTSVTSSVSYDLGTNIPNLVDLSI